MEEAVRFKEKDKVIFQSVHGDHPFPTPQRNGTVAEILEREVVPESKEFPHGVAFRIQFAEDLRETWCRIDEMKLV